MHTLSSPVIAEKSKGFDISGNGAGIALACPDCVPPEAEGAGSLLLGASDFSSEEQKCSFLYTQHSNFLPNGKKLILKTHTYQLNKFLKETRSTKRA